jgi:hypothetical protein
VLNQQLLTACQEDERRLIAGREQTVGASMVVEREHLLPLAIEGIDLALTSFSTVNGLGCVKVLTNAYSVPLPVGTQVQAKVYASTVELWHEGRCVAGTSAVTGRSRSSISSIIWMCCLANQEHWPDPSRCNRNGKPVCGPLASIRSGKRSWKDMVSRAAPSR